MADENICLESYLTCFVCSETLRDPVSLECTHSFCSACLQELWRYSKSKTCPVCRKKSSKLVKGVNVALKEFADCFSGRLKSKPVTEIEMVCSKHKEDPKLFCRDEQRALCSVCDALHQKGHKVIAVRQAVTELKDQLKSDIKTLQDKKKKFKEARDAFSELSQHSQKQTLATEKKIKALFTRLQRFLKEEEESRLAALREEEEQKGKAMANENVDDKLLSLSDCIYAVEEDLQKPNLSFLNSYKATQKRTRSQSLLADPQVLSGVLIDVAKHLGNLSYKVWAKMKASVTFTPVILDPNTANRWLYLSNDLTSVRHGNICQQIPDNRDRNSQFHFVLGSEGFSSGKHSWDVEVGDHPDWTVGLAKESIDRSGEIFTSPNFGFWCLQHRSGKYTDGIGGTVRVKKTLLTVRVELDYDRGEVSFYHPEDMTLIFTHTDTFTDNLFPCFSVGHAVDAKSKYIKICQLENFP